MSNSYTRAPQQQLCQFLLRLQGGEQAARLLQVAVLGMGEHPGRAGHVHGVRVRLHLLLQAIHQPREQLPLAAHLLAELLHHLGIFAHALPGEALGQQVADGVEVIGRDARGIGDDRVLVHALVRHGHHQGRGVGQRHELDARDGADLRRDHHRGVVGHGRQRLRGRGEHVLHLAHAAGEDLSQQAVLAGRQSADPQNLIDVQSVRPPGRHPPRRRVRGGQVPQLLQVAHLVADGGRGQPHPFLARDGPRADRHGGRDVVVDDGLQNLKLSLVQVHVSSGSFPALRGILLALRFAEC